MADQSYTLTAMPLYMENVTGNAIGDIKYSAADFRTFTTGLNPHSGVLGPTSFMVSQADNVGYAIKVAPGFALVGNYFVRMGSPITMALPFVTNPSTTCVHRVYLIIHDEAYFANGTGYEARIVASESIGGADVFPPTDAAVALELATITYAPNQPNVQNKDIGWTADHAGGFGYDLSMTPTLNSAFMVYTDQFFQTALRARYYSPNIVRLAGSIVRRDNGTFGRYQDLGRMPVGWWPTAPRRILASTGPTYPINTEIDNPTGPLVWEFFIGETGYYSGNLPPNNTPKMLHFDGITYELD